MPDKGQDKKNPKAPPSKGPGGGGSGNQPRPGERNPGQGQDQSKKGNDGKKKW